MSVSNSLRWNTWRRVSEICQSCSLLITTFCSILDLSLKYQLENNVATYVWHQDVNHFSWIPELLLSWMAQTGAMYMFLRCLIFSSDLHNPLFSSRIDFYNMKNKREKLLHFGHLCRKTDIGILFIEKWGVYHCKTGPHSLDAAPIMSVLSAQCPNWREESWRLTRLVCQSSFSRICWFLFRRGKQ